MTIIYTAEKKRLISLLTVIGTATYKVAEEFANDLLAITEEVGHILAIKCIFKYTFCG